MPQNSAPNLTVQFTSVDAGSEYSYASLSLLDAFPDSSQLEVLWDVDTVYSASGGAGTSFNVEDLADEVQTAIKTLILDTHYTINPTTKIVTINSAAIENDSIDTINGTYFYPPSFTISGSQNLKIRRSTDITNQVVTFQPGSRLTAENLNLSSGQLFNAIQELTAFGSGVAGGTIADLDLSNNSIQDLSDVALTSGTPAIAYWNGSNLVNGTDVGTLVPDNELETTDGKTLVSSYVDGGSNPTPSFAWEYITFDEVTNNKAGDQTLQAKLSLVDTNISNLQNVTAGLSRPGSDNTQVSDNVTLVDSNLTLDTGDVVVTAGDVTIQGESVYDYISNEPYFWQLPASSMVDITGEGVRLFGNSTDFTAHTAFQFSSTAAISDFNPATGIWTAPRDMVVSVSASLLITAGEADITIYKNTIEVGAQHRGSSIDSNTTLTRVFNVSLNDEVRIEVDRTNSSGNLEANRASASLHEVR